ncbi:uncharacterized protein LOC112528433 [Cynara cardunculus var. scolymus]|uniref:Small ubiquitin-related modifier, SUMO n=1 Tax=Cynara cardunculus var. scolymus TaxID=59895 RepID=A0A118JXZ9_CYNCS|nr:uncharacterized protein LOC112528433 [Cynara cardunculus var. scolymus]KVH96265.1 Small ubiquitin-related modifier, SUMO [Cynara cardunculus var. scolymus]
MEGPPINQHKSSIDSIKMAEPEEELEPLFDYSRVQPFDVVCLDDDDYLDVPPIPSKRRKHNVSAAVKVQEAAKVINIDEGEDNDDLDWLAPPPKVAVDKKLCENSIIKELRLKKQELMSFTESAKDMLRSVEEAVKRDLTSSMNSACENPTGKPSKPAIERPKIVISIQEKDGLKQFRIYKDDKFERLFKMYADKVKHKIESLVFCFDGDKIDPKATPSSLEMEDDDIVEVHVKSS